MPFHVLALDTHICDFVPGSVMSIRNYFRPSNGLSEPMGSISVALKSREQGTLCPPCARSAEYFLCPVTVHSIVLHRCKNSEHKCPMIVPSFFTDTAYQSEAFSGSLSHTNDSPTTVSILVYIRGSLGKSFRQQLLSPYVSLPCSSLPLLMWTCRAKADYAITNAVL